MFGSTNMLILKVTRDCNLRCKYCYIKNKDNYKGELISFETFKTTIDRVIKERIKNGTKGKFTLVFHGGEPLLMGIDKFKLFLSYSTRQFNKFKINYSLAMQTNLTLLNDEFLILLHDYNVSVGVSFDGIKESNLGRTEVNTDKFEKYFKKLEEFHISYGFLIVANKYNINNIEQSIDYVFDKYNISSIKINYAEDVVEGSDSEISGEEFFNLAWKPVLNGILSGKYTSMIENNLEAIIGRYYSFRLTNKLMIEEGKSNCGLKICGGGLNIIEMDPTGEVFFCGRYSESYPEVYVQDVKDDEFLELKQISRYFDTVKIQHKLISNLGCDLCPADNICDHGCMAFHYSKYGEFGIRDNLVCNIFKPLHSFLIKNEVELFEKMFDMYKNKDNEWYFNLGFDIENIIDSNLYDRLHKLGYSIIKDKTFISDSEYNPQLLIKKE